MKSEDRKAQERILKKIKLIRSSGSSIDISETKLEKKARIERATKDVKFCVEYYFPHYATAECADFQIKWAKRVKKDPEFIGFAKWGRGQAKSVWNNVIIPFWLWLDSRDEYFVLIGQNETRAKKLLEDIRLEFEVNPRIINDFGEQKKTGKWEEGDFQTKNGFIGQALGLGQSCRGLRIGNKRPSLVNGDDLETRRTIKNELAQDDLVEWFETELLGALDGDSEHGFSERVIISNNWFAPMMFIKKLAARHPDWHVNEVLAYDPITIKPTWHQKYTPEYFMRKRKKMGHMQADAEYCHKVHVKGKYFLPEEIQWSKIPRLDYFEAIVAHWDVAYAGTAKSDYNAVRIWGLKNKEFYYITSFVKQTKMRAAIEFMYDFEKHKPKNCIIHWQFEAQFWNDEIQRTLEEVEEDYGFYLPIEKVQVEKVKKVDRILTLKPYYQNNRIWYNINMQSHNDTQVGLAQLYAMEPNHKSHDDAPDADQQCIKKLETFIYTDKKGSYSMGIYKLKHDY